MRTRDSIFTCSAQVVDAASGAGIAQPGNVPFTFTRPSAGVYHYRFYGVGVISAVASSAASGDSSASSTVDATDPTFLQIVTVVSAAYANLRHAWTASVKVIAR